MEERIRKTICDILGKDDTNFVVKRPQDLNRGDYAIFIGENAEKIASDVKKKLGNSVYKVEVINGFVNITLSNETIALTINEASASNVQWGKGGKYKGKRILIEYTDPNPFKEMHIGHLMSNVIGEAIARLIENEGANVIRANYQGDIGPHVAKALWGLMKKGIKEPSDIKEIGRAYAEGSCSYEDSAEAKAEIDSLNSDLYAGKDHELIELWRKGRDISLEEFERVYKILGTHFDYCFFESETATSGLRIVRDGVDRGVFEESEGAVIYRGEKKGLHTLVFVTGAGTPTYEAKDIGLAFLKEERVQSDVSLIVTAAEQAGHFRVMLSALEELAPLIAQKTKHISHGFMRLPSGKMSSREGNVVTVADFIDGVTKKVIGKNPDPLIAEQVALSAIKFMILRQSPGSDIIFDEDKSLSLEGDSGPYLQYSLVRAKKILTYASDNGCGLEIPSVPYDIERLIIHFPEVADRAARELAPNLLVNYLIELAGEWNSFYTKEQVLGSPEESYKQRVTRAFANTMSNGLALLGIPAPEKM